MHYIADGSLIAAVHRAGIQWLSLYGGPSFLGLSTGLSLISHYESGILQNSTPAISHFDGRIEITDFAVDGCFVRHVETTKPFDFQLLIPGYCHVYRYPDFKTDAASHPCLLLRIPQGVPTPDGGYTHGEQRLTVAVVGDGSFSDDCKSIRLEAGRTTLLFGSVLPGDEQKAMEKRISQLDAMPVCRSRLYRDATMRHQTARSFSHDVRLALDTLLSLTAESGGALAGAGDGRCLLADQATVGQAFLHLKMKPQAIQTAEFLLSRLETLGYLPLWMSATDPHQGCERTDREWVLYPFVALFFMDVYEIGGKNLRLRLQNALKLLYTLTCEKAQADLLPFSETEYPMRKGALPIDRSLYGNASASAAYLFFLHRLSKEPFAGTVPDAKPPLGFLECFTADFFAAELPTVDSPRRLGRMRMPRTLYGSCPTCREDARYIGWLTRGKYGAYLCPGCYANGKRELLSHGEAVVLPGSGAQSREFLWRAGHIDRRHFCRYLEKCIRYEEMIPEEVAFSERARLAAVLRESGDPHYRTLLNTLYDSIRRRQTLPDAAECALYLLAQMP